MDFLWLDINASFSHSSLALPALEAQLTPQIRKQSGWRVVSGTIKSNKEQIISQIITAQPHYVFATGWLFNIEYLLSVLSRAAAINSSMKIVLGGPEFLGNNEQFLLANPYITAIFKGEAEEVFPQFIQSAIEEPNALNWLSLPGFEYISTLPDGTRKYIQSNNVTAKDFTSLNTPESSEFFNWGKAFVQLETSRGCFNTCKFCVSGIDSSPVQNIPIEQIRVRLENIADKGIKEVRILDRTFNANAQRALDLLNLFEEFAGRLKFHLEVHPALLNEKVKEKLANVPENLLHIEAGIQSLNERVLEGCSRKGTSAKAIEGLRFLLGTGKFEVHTDFIAGLPGYTYNNLLADIKSMIGIYPHEIQLELLKLLPGTCFREHAAEYGIKYSPEPPYEVLQTPAISYEELRKCLVLSKIIEYWYNDPAWRNTFAKIATNWQPIENNLSKKDSGFIEEMVEYLSGREFLETVYSFESKSQILYDFCKERYPQFLPQISLGWISNGLSIKKEPAQGLQLWSFKNPQVANPVLDEDNVYNSYYYMEIEGCRYWFVYNKAQNRNRPIITYKENA